MSSPASPWVDGLTIGQVLAQTATNMPQAEAMVFPALGKRYTWAEFDRAVYEAAKGLMALGIQPGQHVAVWATNVPEWVILQMATARIGAVMVTINPAYRPFELKYVLQQSDTVALFLVDSFKSSNYFDMIAQACPELAAAVPGSLESEQFPKLKWVVSLRDSAPASPKPPP